MLINCKQILITEKSQQIYLIELLKRGLLSGLQIKKIVSNINRTQLLC